MFRVWCERRLPGEFREMLRGKAEYVGSAEDSPGGVVQGPRTADAVVASSHIRYDGGLMDRLPTLQVISRTGVGIDNVAISEASRRGIIVCNVPDGPTVSTAEHTITLILAVAKELRRSQGGLERGERTDYFGDSRSIELRHLLLGVVGLGRIGREVAELALGLRMRVLAYDASATITAPLGVDMARHLGELLESVDVVTLHVPLSNRTRGLIGRDELGRMKKGSILINTARGGLVDEEALLEALHRGHLHGAGLDTLDREPPPPDHALLALSNVVITPHVAAATVTGKQRLWRTALEQALMVLEGKPPWHMVNPEIWERRRGLIATERAE
ncbi:MAG: 2-hydroxyacid dehydrogenase [Vicinamibacteraceae bacterium]